MPTSKQVRGASSIGGAGVGTLLLFAVRNIPDANPWKTTLLALIPGTSVFLTAAFSFIGFQIKDWWHRHDFNKEFQEAQRAASAELQNPNITETHKAFVIEQLEMIGKIHIGNAVQRVIKSAHSQEEYSALPENKLNQDNLSKGSIRNQIQKASKAIKKAEIRPTDDDLVA